MKRAKIMLLAIAVIATVGGALAFKAQKFADMNVYCKSANGACLSAPFRTTPVAGEATFTTPCTTTHPAAFSSSYYTTNGCGSPIRATVYSTIVE